MITLMLWFHLGRFPYEPPPLPQTPCGKPICYYPRPIADRVGIRK